MTSPTNRTDEVRKMTAEETVSRILYPGRGNRPYHVPERADTQHGQQFYALVNAITSAVEAERERCAMVAENGMAYSSGIEIATAIRQTPTQELDG